MRAEMGEGEGGGVEKTGRYNGILDGKIEKVTFSVSQGCRIELYINNLPLFLWERGFNRIVGKR